jgi:3-oxoacyl-[acyl-carrier-protein] synthase-3
MGIIIKDIEYYLPENVVSNEDLQREHPEWDLKKVEEKSGVFNRYITTEAETAFDLACKAVEKLFAACLVKIEDIQGVIFCTQSPDYIMPSNSFLIHKHFKFKQNVWTFDYNLACSGFVYGVAIARGMIETGMAQNVLLITADTYSKYINSNDRSTRVLFGDGAAATIISKSDLQGVEDILLASSGNEFNSFYIPAGGSRMPAGIDTKKTTINAGGNELSAENIHMNGFAIWKFISQTVPDQINSLLARNNIDISDIEFFGFHQASKLTIDSLVKALKINEDRVYTNMDKVGNTVSASIPILLKDAEGDGSLKRGDLVLLSGFGVGLSWGSLIMRY